MKRYYPIFLILAYLIAATVLLSVVNGWDRQQWMRLFMGGFFLVFSFFKFLDLPGFSKSYASYDVIAKRWSTYGYLYPFIELMLGILYLSHAFPRETNIATLVVMSVSSVGVIKAMLEKRDLQCACLGTMFSLPVSTVTLVEDLLMVAMAGWMVVVH